MNERRKRGLTFADSRTPPLAFPFFSAAVHNSPHFEKRYKGGEDGYLLSSNKRMLGVADGVGGWASKDVCSGKCSKFLCKKMCDLFDADNDLSLRDLLYEAIKEIKS